MAQTISKRSVVFDVLIKTDKAGKSLDNLDKRTKKAQKGMGDFTSAAKTAGVALAGAFAVGSLISFTKELTRTAVQMEAFTRRAKVVFGEAIGIVEEFGKANARSLGLTQTQFKGAAAAIGDLIVPLGLTRKEAAQMSVELTKLGGALKQFTGDQRSAAEISNIVARALTGEVEGLKTLGVSINQNTKEFKDAIKTKIRERGVTELQAKALVIYEQALAKSSDALTAFENDTGSLTRQTQELTAEMAALNESLAGVFTPLLLSVTKTTNLWFESLNKTKEELTGLDVQAIQATGTIGALIRAFATIGKEGRRARAALSGTTLTGSILGPLEEDAAALGVPFALMKKEIDKVPKTLNFLKEKLKQLTEEFETTDVASSLFVRLRNQIEAARLEIEKLTSANREFGSSIVESVLPAQVELIGTTENQIEAAGRLESTQITQSTLLDQLSASRKNELADTAESTSTVIGGVAQISDAITQLFEQGSAQAKAFALISIITEQAKAIAAVVSLAARGSVTPIDYFINIAALTASVIAGIAQAKAVLSQAASTSIPTGNVTAPTGGSVTRFAEGEIDIKGGQKGKDSIPALLMPGESIMTTLETFQHKDLLMAIRKGNLDEFIFHNHISPTVIDLMGGQSTDNASDYKPYSDYELRLDVKKNRTVNLSNDTVRSISREFAKQSRTIWR